MLILFEQPDERPEATDKTSEELFPMLPSRGDQIDTSIIDESSYGVSQNVWLLQSFVVDLYNKLGDDIGQTPQAKFIDLFEIRDEELYYKGMKKSLTTKGRLRTVGQLKTILGKERLRNLGFNIPKSRLSARQATILNKTEADLPTSFGIAKADDLELENIASSASKSTSDLIAVLKDSKQTSTDDLFEYPLRELLGLGRTMKTIQGYINGQMSQRKLNYQSISILRKKKISLRSKMIPPTLMTSEKKSGKEFVG